jgi:PIN domain nuclease of toxin-antitoxin system
MNLLIDTHIFLWLINNDPRLPDSFRDAVHNPQNEVYLSVVSIWEALIKYQKGKLLLPQQPEKYLIKRRQQLSIATLRVTESCTKHLLSLPDIHGDPFDRMLICQAIEYDLTFATTDALLRNYPVKFLT